MGKLSTPDEMRGTFDRCTPEQKEALNETYARFFYRTTSRKPDGTQRHADGSAGEIEISPQQLRDLLAHVLLNLH